MNRQKIKLNKKTLVVLSHVWAILRIIVQIAILAKLLGA